MSYLKVKSVILYGSRARGDSNKDSDTDICFFVDGAKTELTKEMIQEYANLGQDDEELNISCYTEQNLIEMTRIGSLFLWHLKIEGRPLFGEEYFNELLHNLPKFANHKEDLLYHREIYKDLIESNVASSESTAFDYSLLFTIVRNTSIILCDKNGTQAFGKLISFRSAKKKFTDFPFELEDYEFLCTKKSEYDRNNAIDSKKLIDKGFNYYAARVHGALEYALEKIEQIDE